MAYGTAITPVVTNRAGVVVPATAAASQMSLANTEGEMLLVYNNSGGTLTLTIHSHLTFEGGTLTVTNKTVTVANGMYKLIGPFPKALYNDATDGLMHFDFSATTSVTVSAIDMGSN